MALARGFSDKAHSLAMFVKAVTDMVAPLSLAIVASILGGCESDKTCLEDFRAAVQVLLLGNLTEEERMLFDRIFEERDRHREVPESILLNALLYSRRVVVSGQDVDSMITQAAHQHNPIAVTISHYPRAYERQDSLDS
jgi:hypothetical protein